MSSLQGNVLPHSPFSTSTLPVGSQHICALRLVEGRGASIAAGSVQPDVFPWHRHDEWLIAIQFGAAWSTVAWKCGDVSGILDDARGDFVFLSPPGCSYQVTWRSAADLILLLAQRRFVEHFFSSYVLTASPIGMPLAAIAVAHQDMVRVCQQVRLLVAKPRPAQDWRLAGLGDNLSAIMFEAHTRINEGEPLSKVAIAVVGQVDAYILKQARGEKVPVEKMARALSMSGRNFRRVFNRATGRSPQEYVITKRLDAALLLLKSGNCTVEEAAEGAGFSSAGHLRRLVRKALGVTPSSLIPRA
ncbi:MAG: AraC family transcriptional regulator [Verrucomicrobia bacterium]|nr:AraC family transcriptional regulator [Verrucomicrobiota bacterium]